jgi:hypothetical protein
MSGSLRRQVRIFRAKLTEAKLDGKSVDESMMIPAIWFTTLLANHNNPDCDFHLDMYEPFIIGQDFDLGEDIVYMNMSSLYFLFNILRNIEYGWLFQLNGDLPMLSTGQVLLLSESLLV